MSKEVNEKTLVQQVEKAEIVHEEIEVQQLTKAQDEYEKSGYTRDRDFAVKIFGQVQAHQVYAKLGNAASLAELMHIKENKLYKHVSGLIYIDSDGNKLEALPTWEGYLSALGLSRRTIDEQILNCSAVGKETYEAMSRIGVGSRTFRKLRQLPKEDRSIIVNEIEANLDDKDSILSLIDDLSEKHVKEKEELKKCNESFSADLQASRQRVTEQSKEVTDLKAKLYHRDNFAAYPDLVNSTRFKCTEVSGQILIQLDKFDQLRDQIINIDLGEYSDDEGAVIPMEQAYWSMLWQVQVRVADLLEYANQTFGNHIDSTMLNRAYPDIDAELKENINSAVDEQVKALKDHAESSKVR